MKSFGTLILSAALFSAPALAQNYVVTSSPQQYQPLTGATAITFSTLDDDTELIPIGFSFPYYGQNYTQVGVSTNGFIFFNASNTTAFTTNDPFPSTSTPNGGVIAAWWDDLKGASSSQVRYKNPTPNELVIEFHDWGYYSAATPMFSFQIKLDSSGIFSVHYGPHGSETHAAEMGAGWEDQAGTAGGGLFACGQTGTCSHSDWPANTLYIVGQPVQADLTVPTVITSNMVKTGSDLTFDVKPTFRNLGQTAANNFHWKAYLSTDRQVSAQDMVVYDSSAGGSAVSVPALSSVTVNPAVSASATNVPPGNFYVLVEADSTNVITTEFSKTNNVGSTATYFTQGVDLVASSVSSTATGAKMPGDPVTVNVNWTNQGTDPAGTVQFRLLLSSNQSEGNDTVVYTATRTVTGGQTINEAVTFNLPSNIPGGDQYWGLQVDSTGLVTEADETNNIVFASSPNVFLQADLEAISVELLDPYTSVPTRSGLLGDAGKVRVSFGNVGTAPARNFKIGVVLSRDSNPSLLNDKDFHHGDIALINPGATQTVEFDVTFPTTDLANQPYPSGNYYIFIWLDSYGEVTELNEGNNMRFIGSGGVSQPVNLRAPAADYAVTKVEAPATGAVGEIIPIHRIIKNVGNLDGKAVSYRFFASANEIIDPADPALLIMGPNGQVLDAAEVTLAKGASSDATEFVRVPATLQPGSWYIGAVVDVARTEDELNETNNAFAAPTRTQIVASSLLITNQQLPDAVVGQPYLFKLSAVGADGPLLWSLLEGDPPLGLALSGDGVISGTPTVATVGTFTVEAATATRAAAARLVVRVVPPSGQLVVTTQTLPAAVNVANRPYSAALAASGGSAPYRWAIVSGTLPNGLTLASSGELSGALRPGVKNEETALGVEVTDQLGSRARAGLKFRVVEPGALYITTLQLRETMVQSEYITDLAARNMDNTALAKPLVWSVVGGRLPEGLELTTSQQEKGLIAGTPIEAGTFPIAVQVVDAKQRADVTDLVLRVHPARAKLSASNIPATLHPGDAVSVQITTGDTRTRYRLYSGALPPGVTMDENGLVAGTLEAEGSVGTWAFVVEAHNPTVGIEGASLGAFALEVTPAPVKTGCTAAPVGSGFGWISALFAGLVFFARPRRRART